MIAPEIEAELESLAPFRRTAGSAPGTLYRRAVRRVDRRAAALLALDRSDASLPDEPNLWLRLTLDANLREAVRLANSLAYLAGIGGPLACREAPR